MSRQFGQKGLPGEQCHRPYQTSLGSQSHETCGQYEGCSSHDQYALTSGDCGVYDVVTAPFAPGAGQVEISTLEGTGLDQYQQLLDVSQSYQDYNSIPAAAMAVPMYQNQHLELSGPPSERAFAGRVGEQVKKSQPFFDQRQHFTSNCEIESFGMDPVQESNHRTDPWSPYAMDPEQQPQNHQAGLERLPSETQDLTDLSYTVSSMVQEDAPTSNQGSLGSQFASSDSSYSLTQQDLIDSSLTMQPEYPPTYPMFGVEDNSTMPSQRPLDWRYVVEPPQHGEASGRHIQPLIAKAELLVSPFLVPPPPSPIPLSDDTSTTGSVTSTGSRHCADCGTEFTGVYKAGNLARHRRLMHREGSSASYACEQCDKVFKRTDSRLKHYRKSHHGLAADPIRRSGHPKARDHHHEEQDINLSNIGSRFGDDRQAP